MYPPNKRRPTRVRAASGLMGRSGRAPVQAQPHPQIPPPWSPPPAGAGVRGGAAGRRWREVERHLRLPAASRGGRRGRLQRRPGRGAGPPPHPHPHGRSPLTVTAAAPPRVERDARGPTSRGTQARDPLAGSASPRPSPGALWTCGAQRQRGYEGARWASRN